MHFLKLGQAIINPAHVIGITPDPTNKDGVDVIVPRSVAECVLFQTADAFGTTDDDAVVFCSCVDAEATAIRDWARQHPAMEEILPGYFINETHLISIEPYMDDVYVWFYVQRPAATVLFGDTSHAIRETEEDGIEVVCVEGADADYLRTWTQHHPRLVMFGDQRIHRTHVGGMMTEVDTVMLAGKTAIIEVLFGNTGYEIIEEEEDVTVVMLKGAETTQIRAAMEHYL